MKNSFLNLRAMLLLAVLLCGGVSAFAYTTIWQDSIEYKLISDDLTAYVSDADNIITTANIPEKITYEGNEYTVTSIGNYAFQNCSSLASVVIPNSVTSIGASAFYGCSSLASVVIPNSVTSIGGSAFEGCGSLASVDIPNSVTSIGESAFYGCSSLASVDIPNSVTSIRNMAFYGCSRLNRITIGSGVQFISEGAFKYGGTYIHPEIVIWLGSEPPKGYEYVKGECNYVSNESFTGLSNTKVYPFLSSMLEKDSVKYVLVNPSERTCVAISYAYAPTTVCIPEKVTREGKDYTVTGIEAYTFYGCRSLVSVVIPNSVTSIGKKAFWQCGSLHSVTMGSGVQSIDETAFADGTESNSYGYGWHYKYISPKKVIWPGNTPPEGHKYVNGIYNYVSNDSFTGLSNTKVYPFLSSMFEKDGIKYVPVKPAERTCDAIDCAYDTTAANINIGKMVNYKGVELAVKDIRPYTCYRNKYIQSVKVGYGGAIRKYAFYGCDSVASTDITATKIGVSAFENSATKEPAKFEINADTIESSAFKGSRAVTEAKITAKTIGESAFENCATKEPAKFEINADKIESSAFKGSRAVTEAKITAKTIGASAFENSATKEAAKFEISADTIESSAFKGNSAITEAKITAKAIGASAFENSATKEPAKFEITADKIGDNAFTGCSKLEDAVLGENLKSVGDCAFKDCASLNGITIPDSVTVIGGRCFSGCESLAYAKIGAGVSVIPDETFNNCKSLPEITIPKTVDSIGDKVFYGCASLANVTIADRETELKLGSNGSSPMFSSCPLKSVYIGGNITYGTTANDGYSPFYRNTSLETVRITDRETEISENEFYGCTSLKSVSMGDGIDTIGRYAFSGCSALESFSFGTGLKSIGDEAFSDCTGMKKLVSKTAVPPVCGPQALDDINKWECTLYVPQESLDDYKSAAQWKEFFFLETGIKDAVRASDTATEEVRYSTDGTRLASPQKGINIIRMSDGTVKKVLVK